jgi:glutamate dehydrogenase (NAD(P)+)
VFVGLKALVEADDSAMRGLRIAIEGFGEVGSHLALLLADTGANVVAVSTSQGAVFNLEGLDIPRLLELRDRYENESVNKYAGAERIPCEDLLALEVDALCPCASIHTIHAGNIDSLNARYLCPGANNPWPEELQQSLEERQIQYLPDYVANSGGVLGTTMAYLGFMHPEIVQFIHVELGRLYRYLLHETHSGGRAIEEVAAEFLLKRSAGAEGTGGGFSKLILRMGMNFHRRGLVPRFVTRMFALGYLRGRIRTGLPAEIAQVETQRRPNR